ncbi:MAG: GAF domain-containing protein [Anaerolineales bacterium]|nr:GAF domain-containing protein [Anaerolineales bacterium]
MTTQPARSDPGPVDKANPGKRSSIRTKITFWAGLWLALVSFILIGYSVFTFRNAAIDNATKEALAFSEVQASQVMDVLSPPLVKARTLAESLEAVKDPSIPIALSRDEANAILRKVLLENPSFLGTYTLWEPNEFDGSDRQYARAVAHDETGRFIPYWVRDLDGIIHTEALTQYEIPGVGDWYIIPRSTLKEVAIAPIVRRIQGQDLTIASFIVPIVSDGKFYGIAGVDAPIGVMQELVDRIDLYEGSAEVALFTESGTLVAVRNRPEIANQSVDLIYNDYNQIRSQLGDTFSRLSQDGKYLQIFSPIKVDDAGTRWVLGFSIPFDKITAPATSAAVRQVVISLAFIALALIFLWFVAGQIVRPMQALTQAAQTVSAGNLNVTADVRSNDETGVLAGAFNSMTLQLRTLFATLEQHVAERTKALATVAEVGASASTILETDRLLQEVVDLTKERFDFYHAHIYLLDETGENLTLAAGAGEPGRRMVAEGHSIPLNRERSLVARAARDRKGVTVNDVTAAPDFLPNPLLPDTRSELAAPMIVGEQAIGVFDVQSDQVGRFTEADVDVQTALAAQIAVAVQNARQYDRMQAALAQTEKLFEGSRFVTQAENLQEMVASIVNLIHIPALNGALLMTHNRDGQNNIESIDIAANWWSGVGEPVFPVGTRFSVADTPGLEAFVSPVNLFFNDIYTDERTKDSMRESGIRSIAVLPLFVGSRQIGAFGLLGKDPYDFTQDDIRLLSSLAPQIATVLENRRQFERAQSLAEHEALANVISRKIQGADSVEAVLQIAASELGHVLGAPLIVAQVGAQEYGG